MTEFHLLTDGAAYDEAGVLRSVTFGKTTAMPTIGAAIACTGPVEGGPIIAAEIGQNFGSFDELVAQAETYLPQVFNAVAANMRGGDSACTLYLIGWLAQQNRPAAFCMELATPESTTIAAVIAESGGRAPEFGKLEEQSIAGTPIPGAELREAAGFNLPGNLDAVDPEFQLLHLMEIMRHERIRERSWVGGLALLTTVTARAVEQRVVHRWREDKVGELIEPLSIDWQEWRRAPRRNRLWGRFRA